MALLANSLQGFGISSAEGSGSETCSAAAVSVARRGIPSPSPHFGLSPSVSPPSLGAASGGLLVVWRALMEGNVFIQVRTRGGSGKLIQLVSSSQLVKNFSAP